MPQKTVDQGQQSALNDMIAAGLTPEDVAAAMHVLAQRKNRSDQARLNAPPAESHDRWVAHEAWLHDGQPIYGENGLAEFVWAAYVAAKAGDQAERSRQVDLLYKSALTFTGPPPDGWTPPSGS